MKKYMLLFTAMFCLMLSQNLFASDSGETKYKTVSLGDEIKITCNNLNDIAKVQWYKDGAPIDGQTGDKLVYRSANLSHEGTYYAEVEGMCGLLRTNDMIIQVEVPIQPGIETAVAGGDFLFQNEPNPAGDNIRFKYSLSSASNVRLTLTDSFGNEVAVLFDGYAAAGLNSVEFNAAEKHLANGAYFYTLAAGNFKETKTLILMR